jgi:hypothetical protein
MSPRFIAVLLVFCGFAVTSAQARPRVMADTISTVSPDATLVLKELGTAQLAGIMIADPKAAVTTLEALSAVEIKSLGSDRYGRARILLYRPAATQTMQEALLRTGTAIVYDMNAVQLSWLQAEREARSAKRGIWADNTWIIEVATAKDHIGEFKLVHGTVTRTYKARDAYYINFGEDWKTDFSIAIPRGAWRAFKDSLDGLEGKTITARGVIELDNGPALTIVRPEQMEIH